MAEKKILEDQNADVAARCHEIQVSLGTADVPDFELLVKIGMAVRLAIHIRGLPAIPYESLRKVASHFLSIPPDFIVRGTGCL